MHVIGNDYYLLLEGRRPPPKAAAMRTMRRRRSPKAYAVNAPKALAEGGGSVVVSRRQAQRILAVPVYHLDPPTY